MAVLSPSHFAHTGYIWLIQDAYIIAPKVRIWFSLDISPNEGNYTSHELADSSVGGIGLVKSQIAVGVAQNILLMDQVDDSDVEIMRQTMNNVWKQSSEEAQSNAQSRKKKKPRDPPPVDPLKAWSELTSEASDGQQLLEKFQSTDTIQGLYVQQEDRIFPIWKAEVNSLAGDPFPEYSDPIADTTEQ